MPAGDDEFQLMLMGKFTEAREKMAKAVWRLVQIRQDSWPDIDDLALAKADADAHAERERHQRLYAAAEAVRPFRLDVCAAFALANEALGIVRWVQRMRCRFLEHMYVIEAEKAALGAMTEAEELYEKLGGIRATLRNEPGLP